MLKKLYYFLGSFYFAVGLIATTALIVIAGTIVESLTDSHLYASQLAYRNPVFLFLLSLFFVNILVSALRRWPFQRKHIPFLTTHLGLLMIICGVMVKNSRGTQGQMGLVEGTATDTIFISDSPRLYLQKKGEQPKSHRLKDRMDQIEILFYAPNCQEFYETWIKGDFGFISGIKPFPVYLWQGSPTPSTKMKIPNDCADHWDVYAYRSQDVNETAKRVYLEGLKIRFTNRLSGYVVKEEALNPDDLFFEEQKIVISFADETMTIPLFGPQALLNLQEKTTYFGHYPTAIDLVQTPKLLLIQDEDRDTHFFAFDQRGQIFSECFSARELKSYVSYDHGFGGYSVQIKLPFSNQSFGREEREQAVFEPIKEHLAEAEELSLPLQLFKEACVKSDFSSAFALFLTHWNTLLPPAALPDPLPEIFSRIDWKQISSRDRKGTIFGTHLLRDLEESLMKGGNLHSIIREKKWPLASLIHSIEDPASLLTTLLQQVMMISDDLPEEEETGSQDMFATLLRAYGIHPNAFEKSATVDEGMVFECPLSLRHEPLEMMKKLEENRPMIALKAGKEETLTLAYDPYGLGLKWPLFHGNTLISFRSKTEKIPYRVRLRDARQMNYPGSNQAYSYESDLLITDLKHRSSCEKTVSMNRVHETWDGYRFYLSNISPPNETAAQRIQLVVNRDPAKYWLTYPGGLVIALGILLLFWRRQS